MDHILTPAPSFRPSRPVTRTRNRNRNGHISPSPRPGSRRSFVEPASNAMFITTDCDYDYLPSSSPDSDLIFSMSPIHSHFIASPPSGSEAVNVMTLRNRTRTVASSPPLSPLLYSFPRPSNAHAHARQHSDPHLVPSSTRQKMGAPIHRRVRTLSSREVEAGVGGDHHPLSSSISDTPLPSTTQKKHQNTATSSYSSRPSRLHSSPIPIPRTQTRRADPGQFITKSPPSLILSNSDHSIYDINDPALPSSGLAGHEATNNRVRSRHPSHTSFEFDGSAASSTPLCRIEGFDDSGCDEQEQEQEQALESDSRSPVTPSTTYSYSGSGPFRFANFLDLGGKAAGSSEMMLGGSGGGFPLGDWENLQDRKGL